MSTDSKRNGTNGPLMGYFNVSLSNFKIQENNVTTDLTLLVNLSLKKKIERKNLVLITIGPMKKNK